MVIEFVGAFIVLVTWIVEMHKSLKKKEVDKDHYKLMIVYVIGFLLLAYYSAQINNILLVFFNAFMALVALIEFVFEIIKRK
ncbi:hypothetical protein HYZ41_02000 [archaeon]|nr:hypothetical protein [archaeon]